MKYIMRIVISLTAAALFSGCCMAYAGPTFKPWGSSVRVGDENIAHFHVSASPDDDGKRGAPLKKRGRAVSGVVNGVQGGAWLLIRFFQVAVSPQDGPNCRFIPTCSAYGREAVEKHGAFLGAVMAGERLLRCSPYGHPGVDRVPARVLGD